MQQPGLPAAAPVPPLLHATSPRRGRGRGGEGAPGGRRRPPSPRARPTCQEPGPSPGTRGAAGRFGALQGHSQPPDLPTKGRPGSSSSPRRLRGLSLRPAHPPRPHTPPHVAPRALPLFLQAQHHPTTRSCPAAQRASAVGMPPPRPLVCTGGWGGLPSWRWPYGGGTVGGAPNSGGIVGQGERGWRERALSRPAQAPPQLLQGVVPSRSILGAGRGAPSRVLSSVLPPGDLGRAPSLRTPPPSSAHGGRTENGRALLPLPQSSRRGPSGAWGSFQAGGHT